MTSALFIRVQDRSPETKALQLVEDIAGLRAGKAQRNTFSVSPRAFSAIGGSPFAYWLSPEEQRAFVRLPGLEGSLGAVRVGLQTSDDFRFVRAWWEALPGRLAFTRRDTADGIKWVHLGKGGSFGRYFADVYLILNWDHDGRELKTWTESLPGCSQWSRNIRSADHYFRPGITWPRRTNGLSVRCLPRGCVFSDKGPTLFASSDQPALLLSAMGIMNSPSFETLVKAQLARTELAQSYEVGVIASTPVPIPPLPALVEQVLTAYECARSRATFDEITHAFILPDAVSVAASCGSLADAVAHQQIAIADNRQDLARIQETIGCIAASAYGFVREDGEAAPEVAGLQTIEVPEVSDEDDESEPQTSPASMCADLLSWCVGGAFGRWDARMARDRSLVPAPQGPFDPLPRVAPGGLVSSNGLPATQQDIASVSWLRARPNVISLPAEGSFSGPAAIPDSEFPISVAWDGVLVDDEGHSRDIVAAVRRVLAYVYSTQADAIEAEALEFLRGEDGSAPKTLRDWFRSSKAAALGKSFFEHHIGRYSTSRRKAPIYWRLAASANAPYAVWLYYPRLTKDTLWRVLGDYVTPRRTLAERQLAERRAVRDAASAGTARRRAEQRVTDAVALLESVQALEIELRRVAERRYAPDLDDGVVISTAPLHKVIPWKEPAAVWKKLEAGDYDWSKLAMALWPERVRAKCATDRSLAIAHGLV